MARSSLPGDGLINTFSIGRGGGGGGKICSADYNLKNFGCFLVNCSYCDDVQTTIECRVDLFWKTTFFFFLKKWSLLVFEDQNCTCTVIFYEVFNEHTHYIVFHITGQCNIR